jgi:hypothetical protein
VDVLTILGLGTLLFTLAFVAVRSERRRRRWIILLLPIPTMILVVRWAIYRQAWLETGLASVLAAAAFTLWWLAIGRRLPPPEDTIRVWTQDDPF